MAEEHHRLLAKLPDDSLRFVAGQKLEGVTNDELATTLGLTTRSIERKLVRIRECWERELLP
jgi:DNA-directed RNA polymerase specialized sigma24 family protein